ncbi:chitinase class I [Oesophagostomum dentatum]|uniref:Chitinase class I n=1 Tax=Oesophagostomum dentatum TaxID=61180 RepID=A0A0B1TJ77_OESDE|nr:chitinase class I [Oesophagostomum dentatum]
MHTGVLLCLLFISEALEATIDFCPSHSVFAKDPAPDCQAARDPRNLKKSPIEEWFTEQMFQDLFPKANLGLGPHECLPYSYKSFIIAARYFPEFGGEALNKDYEAIEHQRRDVAAFFAHALQETGENDVSLYKWVFISVHLQKNKQYPLNESRGLCSEKVSYNGFRCSSSFSTEEAAECFYRGGFYNWFERGPNSSFLLPAFPGFEVVDGKRCIEEGRYCKKDSILDFWYPCSGTTETHSNNTYYKGCYFGRGALQLSWNYNYGLFQQFLLSRGIRVDLINNPNLVVTKMDPPLAMLASLWFYMTPQPPKPSMHSIVIGR